MSTAKIVGVPFMNNFRGVAFKRPEAFHYLQFGFIVFFEKEYLQLRVERLQDAFTPTDLKIINIQSSHQYLFFAFGICARKKICA